MALPTGLVAPMSILALYLLSCLPGLIVAMLARLWAKGRNWDRYERAWLVALTIGILCSPGFHVAGQGIAIVIPSLFAAIAAEGQIPKMWAIFLVSSTLTTGAAFAVYLWLSKIKSAEG
jgi:hypothetical protein